MNKIQSLLQTFLEPGDTNIENMKIPKSYVEKMLEITERSALEKGHNDEREELVCRLLANDMAIEEVSLILKIRVDDVLVIEKHNVEKIRDYSKKLKARRKNRERNRT